MRSNRKKIDNPTPINPNYALESLKGKFFSAF